MILTTLNDAIRLQSLHPAFERLFAYLRSTDLNTLSTGRVELDGDHLFINVCDAQLKSKREQKLEVHRAYIDVHIPLSGDEVIGWRALSDITQPSEQPFNEKDDFALYALPATTYLTVKPGQMLFVWPEDAHAPIIGDGTLRKLIVKVRI